MGSSRKHARIMLRSALRCACAGCMLTFFMSWALGSVEETLEDGRTRDTSDGSSPIPAQMHNLTSEVLWQKYFAPFYSGNTSLWQTFPPYAPTTLDPAAAAFIPKKDEDE